MTQPTNPGANVAGRPGVPASSPAAGLMSRPGFMGGMFAGLLGAGLIGLLLGGGLTGGLGGLASFLGLALAGRHHRADRLAPVHLVAAP